MASVISPCPKCNEFYDTDVHRPLQMQCNALHVMCKACLIKQHEQEFKITCFTCNTDSFDDPGIMKENKECFQPIEQRIRTINMYRSATQQLIQQQAEVKQLSIQLNQKKQGTVQKIVQLVEQTLLSSTNDLIQQVMGYQEKIQKQIDDYRQFVITANADRRTVPSPVEINQLINKQSYDHQKQHGQSLIKRLDEIQEELYQQIRVNFEQFCEKLPSVHQPDFKPDVIEDIKQIVTIEKYSKTQKTFTIGSEPFLYERKEIRINESIIADLAQIEQIDNNRLIISGGFNGTRDFLIYENDENLKKYKMYLARYQHRTVNTPDKNFIISGGQDNKVMADCEMFSHSTGKFKLIAEIPKPVMLFGACYSKQQIHVFGGDQEEQINQEEQNNQEDNLAGNEINMIQIFDLASNRWLDNVQVTLEQKIEANATSFNKRNSSLIWQNGYYNFDTSVFDGKDVIKHGNQFEGYWTYAQPVQTKDFVFQFDFNGDLYKYDIANKSWSELALD